MKKNIYPTCVLFDSINDYSHEDFENDCIDLGEDCPYDVNSDEDYYDWLAHQNEIDYDDMITNLQCSDYNTYCVIEGTLGLWDGKHDIAPTICKDLTQAIRKCTRNADTFSVKFENGFINVCTEHHDGTNNFTIKLLSSKGIQLFVETKKYRYGKGYDDIVITPFFTKKIKGYIF